MIVLFPMIVEIQTERDKQKCILNP